MDPQNAHKNRSILFVIRHSERADQVKDQQGTYEKNDPPLTSHGIAGSKVTGEWLRTYLGKLGYKKIIVRSSPFLRTM